MVSVFVCSYYTGFVISRPWEMASGGDMHQCVGGGWLSHCPVSLLLPTAPGSAFSLTLYLRSTCICICIVECLCSLALAAPGLFICFNQSASSAPLKYKCTAVFMGESVNTRYYILSVKKEWACVRLSVCLCVCVCAYMSLCFCVLVCVFLCVRMSLSICIVLIKLATKQHMRVSR